MRRWLRWLLVVSAVLLSPLATRANQNAQGWCEDGNYPLVTSGLTSTNFAQGSFPKCTVTVFVHGGGLATIYSDNASTPLSNPFTADTNGQWLFYAGNGRYDITMSGAGFPAPTTYSDIILFDCISSGCGGGGGGSVFVNGVLITNPNFQDSTAITYSVSGVSNIHSAVTSLDAVPDGQIYFRDAGINGPHPRIENGDFEAGVAESQIIIPPPGWASSGAYVLSYDTTTQYEGAQSLRVVNAGPGSLFNITLTPALPGDTFEVEGAVKGDGTAVANVCMNFLDKNQASLQQNCVSQTAATWVYSTAAGTAPANTVFVALYVTVTNTGATEYDAVNLYRTNFPQIFGPGGDAYTLCPTSTPCGPGGSGPSGGYLCTVSSASTTWTCTHNLGTTTVVTKAYTAGGQEIVPDTLVNTSINVVTLTWLVPRAGYAVILGGALVPGTSLDVKTNGTDNLSQTLLNFVNTAGKGGISFTNPSGGIESATIATGSLTGICEVGIGDGLNAIPAGTYLLDGCYNDYGNAYTITAIRGFTDNNGTSTMNAVNDTATSLLTGPVTTTNAFASGTQSATTTIGTNHWIVFTFVADGTSKTWTGEVTVTH